MGSLVSVMFMAQHEFSHFQQIALPSSQRLSCDKQAGWTLATTLSVLVCRVQRPNTEIPDYVLL